MISPRNNANNFQSRAFPDLSANGANYVVSVDGAFSFIYGTSASSPVVGAILTMVNDARLAKNKSSIGFINPTVGPCYFSVFRLLLTQSIFSFQIYSSGFLKSFNDVTNGTNPGCGTVGFNATKGWDPVTGLGTPNFPALLSKWLALP